MLTVNKTELRKWLAKSWKWRRSKILHIVIIIVFASVASYLLLMARAGTNPVELEAESASRSGNVSVADNTAASGGKTLLFGNKDTSGGTTSCSPSSGPLRSEKSFQGTTTGVAVNYSIVLPDDYYSSCKEYSIVYSLHGKDNSHSEFMPNALTIRQAIDDGILPQLIIVTPDSYSDGRWQNGDKGPAEDNFIKELIPYVEQNYRVKKGASNRLLTGFSMGGHGAFYYAVKYPRMFAATLAVDGAMSYSAADYTQYVEQVKTYKPPIYSMGGQLNGSRVKAIIDAYAGQGVSLPYVYYDLAHDYDLFIAEDKKQGWPAAKYLAQNLGRAIP
ncbi:hypothetical protein JNM87_04935 [Candidatus Saccharibacteria bacterium]|nr:hypothetical protein [Candidatus Saccharibacteria bacterium]